MTLPTYVTQAKQAPRAPRKPDLHTMFIFDVRLDNIDSDAAMTLIRQYVEQRNGHGPYSVFFTNVHSIHLSQKDETLRSTINQADLVLPDGSGVSIAGKVKGNPILENLNGTDLMPKVLRHADTAGWTVYLFGARPDVLDRCHRQLMRQYPGLRIVGMNHGYVSEAEEQALLEEINARQPDLLLVALGSPHQEKWVADHARHLKVGVCFAVGGLFDFLSGVKKRAPRWMRCLGIEWLFRLIVEPGGKWDRTFIEIPLFLTRVFAERFVPKQVGLFFSNRGRI